MFFTNTEEDHKTLTLIEFNQPIIGVTSGCFDLLHPSHIRYLEKCKTNCHTLIVGVDSDSNVEHFKGRLPVVPENDRAYAVSSLKCVDFVFVMNCIHHLMDLMEGLVIKKIESGNEDQLLHLYKSRAEYYGVPVLQLPGIETRIIADEYPAFSTTKLIKHIQKKYPKI